jgi:hypothetical protein
MAEKKNSKKKTRTNSAIHKLRNTKERRRKKSTRRTKSQSSNYWKGLLKIHTTVDLKQQHKRYILSSSFEWDSGFPPLEHLHRCSVCGPALDEMQQLYPGNTLEDSCGPENVHNLDVRHILQGNQFCG